MPAFMRGEGGHLSDACHCASLRAIAVTWEAGTVHAHRAPWLQERGAHSLFLSCVTTVGSLCVLNVAWSTSERVEPRGTVSRGQTQRDIPGAPIPSRRRVRLGGSSVASVSRWDLGEDGTSSLLAPPTPGPPAPCLHPGYSLSPALPARLCCSLAY